MMDTTISVLGLSRMGLEIAQAALLNPNQTNLSVTPQNSYRSAKPAKAVARIVVIEAAYIVLSSDYILISLAPSAARDRLPTLSFVPHHQIVITMPDQQHDFYHDNRRRYRRALAGERRNRKAIRRSLFPRSVFQSAWCDQTRVRAGDANVSTTNGLNVMVRERPQRLGVETRFLESLGLIHKRMIKNITTG